MPVTEVSKGSNQNCDFITSLEKRCRYCGQNHLIAYYCQALNPINADKYPHLHQSQKLVQIETKSHGNETDTDEKSHNETEESQPWLIEGVSRATYFRRKRRAEGKT